METLREAYRMARSNDGAPGIDGVTFEAIEQSGVVSFLEQIRAELVSPSGMVETPRLQAKQGHRSPQRGQVIRRLKSAGLRMRRAR